MVANYFVIEMDTREKLWGLFCASFLKYAFGSSNNAESSVLSSSDAQIRFWNGATRRMTWCVRVACACD